MSYYESGGQPAGVLKTETDLGGYVKGPDGQYLKATDGSYLTKRDMVRREWERVHRGPNNSHRVAILDLSLDYKPLAATNADAQFVESQDVSVKDLARYFGVPLYKLQEGKQSYSSNEQNAIEYVVGTLHPTVTQYEEEYSYKLLTASELRRGLSSGSISWPSSRETRMPGRSGTGSCFRRAPSASTTCWPWRTCRTSPAGTSTGPA